MTFRKGDRVRILVNCRPFKMGDILIIKNSNIGRLGAGLDNDSGICCFHDEYWKLVTENPHLEGGEKNVAEFKDGDEAKHVRACPSSTPVGVIGIYNDGKFDSGSWHCSHLETWELISGSQPNTMALETVTTFEQENLSPEALAIRKVGLVDSAGDVVISKFINMMYKLNFKDLAALAQKEVAEEEAKLAVAKKTVK